MEIKATQKFVRMSPKKIRFVADVARKMSPREAVERLSFIGRKGSGPIILTIKSALANAKAKGIDEKTLVIKELQIGEGPRLKRGRPVSRGRWHPYKRRMSHIRVILTTKEQKNLKTGREESEKNVKSEEKKENILDRGILKAVKKAVVGKRKAVNK